MSHKANDQLVDTIRDMAATGLNDPERFRPVRFPTEPTAWDFVKDDSSKFGPQHDFYVQDNVFYAVSIAALNWCYSKLPPDLDRVNVTGFRIEPQWIDFIVHRAKQDRLMSLEDFEQAMNEQQEQRRQWE